MTVRSIVRRVSRWVVSGEVLAAPRSQEGVEEGGGVRRWGGGGAIPNATLSPPPEQFLCSDGQRLEHDRTCASQK